MKYLMEKEMKKLLILVLVFSLTSCTNQKGAIAFLTSQGYSNIETTGFDILAHGEDDLSTTGFITTSLTGKTVKGAVSDKGWSLFRPKMNLRIWSEK